MSRKVCIVTGTRAEWGLLSGIARQLNMCSDIDLQIIATNMHLSDRHGHTIDEIIQEGFKVSAQVPMLDDANSDCDTVRSMAKCMHGMAEAFDNLRPHIVVLLGDRFEMLAVATAATIMRIPIVHLHGGEISEGAIDDSMRHAITKLSALHLTSTEEYRQRVIQMGENPERVINTGAIGVYNVMNVATMTLEQLRESLDFEIDHNTLLVTLHPATLDTTPIRTRCQALLNALDSFPNNKLLITYPNNDPDGMIIIEMIEQYARLHPTRVKLIPSLGLTRYMSALKYVAAVVGNSSSGIIEVPSMGIPTVNIGCRQKGRIAATSVIDCEPDTDSIVQAITKALSNDFKEQAQKTVNPYYRPDTLQLIVKAIATTPIETLHTKHFHDIGKP
ncbi:MAG: UDP-N-acetylglucosamine 2-epimerase (hydrolyzing) [Muribaculaceae bacterium]|nr:UDP-N-acetylglucosamine 2-epimerase (hydrolyzing) [Muribaculaceae bacterium]